MTDRTLLARCAPIAIAIAALPAAPALAQDAATPATPVIVLDPVPATEAPQDSPRIVLPDPVVASPLPQSSIPASTPQPEAAGIQANASPAATSSAPGRAESPQAAARREAPNAAASIPPSRAIEAEPFAAAPAGAVPASAAAPALVAEPLDIDAAGDVAGQSMLLGLLAALGIGAGAFALVRSRRRRAVGEAEPALREVPVKPLPQAVAASGTAGYVLEREHRVGVHDEPVAAEYAPEQSVPQTASGSPAIALPAAMPATYAERDSLMRRLVALNPDRTNPFRSPKARARRARLIMQSLGRDFEGRKPRFDLGNYLAPAPRVRRLEPATA